MNNYERIKTMTVDEMAEFCKKHHTCIFCHSKYICETKIGDCLRQMKQWLMQEVKDE